MLGCATEVTDDELATPAEADVLEEDADDTLEPSVAGGDELHDHLLCNKTCILECGDCSCCL